MITKITCRYSFEVLDFHCNDFGFTFNIGVSYLGIRLKYTNQFKLMLYTQFLLFAMDADQESAAAAVVIGVLLKRGKSKQRKKRSVWVKPWLQRRNKLGVYHTLLQELRMEAEEEYKKFLRMSPELFDGLLILVKPEIWHLCFCMQWK